MGSLSCEGGRRHRRVTARRATPALTRVTHSDRLGCQPQLGTSALVLVPSAMVGVGSGPAPAWRGALAQRAAKALFIFLEFVCW